MVVVNEQVVLYGVCVYFLGVGMFGFEFVDWFGCSEQVQCGFEQVWQFYVFGIFYVYYCVFGEVVGYVG